MTSQFIGLMTHTFTIRKRSRDWQGNFVDIQTINDVKGFAQYGKQLVTDRNGEEVTAAAVIFLRSNTLVDSEYWMIDQTSPYTRENMEVIRIDPIDDPRTGKTHHYEVVVR
jgi:hypothetical protein